MPSPRRSKPRSKNWKYRARSKKQLPKIFKGARIVRVTENVDQHRMIFELSYPIPHGGRDFPQRMIVFHLCRRYLIDEGHGTGEPTIQRVEILETEPYEMTVRMHTDNGIREVTCSTSVSEVMTI